MRRQAARDRFKRGWRAGVRSQDARGEEVYQLMPEQRIKSPIALQPIGRAHEQSGCNGVGMRRSLQQIGRCGAIGFAGNALEHFVRKIELNDIDRFRNIPSGA